MAPADPTPSSNERSEWPSHSLVKRAWVPSGRPSNRADRLITEITVSIPPLIATAHYAPSAAVTAALDKAARQIMAVDLSFGHRLSSLAQFLIRTEAVSSSKIEYVEAAVDDYAKALAGIRSNESATLMVAATAALEEMIAAAGGHDIRLDDILNAHHVLMRDDPMDGRYAGELRTVQNWIGGSDSSPRGALHVPPPPEMVAELMTDLLLFANRDDVPAVAQAAIVHAQFESIHPFTDGNGRIGRALINAVLRRRELTSQTITPLASAMVADRQRYFDLVNNYRTGSLTPFVLNVAESAQIASDAVSISAEWIEQIPQYWASKTNYRSDSAASAIMLGLLENPVITVSAATAIGGASESSTYAALDRLEADGIIHEVTARKRNRVWVASDVMNEMAALADRIHAEVVRRATTAGSG